MGMLTEHKKEFKMLHYYFSSHIDTAENNEWFTSIDLGFNISREMIRSSQWKQIISTGQETSPI